jgi:hypothetical protein
MKENLFSGLFVVLILAHKQQVNHRLPYPTPFVRSNVDDGVTVRKGLSNPSDEALGSLRSGVDSDELEGSLGSRHCDRLCAE